jgi:hypothetical protein
MQFFAGADGTLYPTSRIVRIDPPTNERPTRALFHLDDEEVEVESFELEALTYQPAATFAALPGTYRIEYEPEETRGYWTTPIIGWTMMQNGMLRAITTNGFDDGHLENKPPVLDILMPDGSVHRTDGGGSYGSIDSWLEMQRKRRTA